jgi:cytochrome c peroxidase
MQIVLLLMLGCSPVFPASSLSLEQPLETDGIEEPITPIPELGAADPLKVKLGERLFGDPRLSHDNSRSCSSCHDLRFNGASRNSQDPGFDGVSPQLNTLTVFNAALNFRFGWEGKFHTLESQTAALLESQHIMGSGVSEVVHKLEGDRAIREAFLAAYGEAPNSSNIIDALAMFERSLLTPGSRFDRWLAGDRSALSPGEIEGYRLFKSLGCVSCHQGVNVGGNLYERHGIFKRLASEKPEILRVPSLRNVATTAPYFHDGSAPTLEDAVRKMGAAQLNTDLTDQQVSAIVAYLKTLTGNFRGKAVGAPP